MKTSRTLIALAPAFALAFLATAAFAQNVTTPSPDATGAATPTATSAAAPAAAVPAKVAKAIARANQELDRRVTALGKIKDRVGQIKHVSDSDKATLTTVIDDQVTALNTLKGKIDADTDLATVKTDAASITKGYRIFALIIPRTTIIAAADRLVELSTELTTLATKLEKRISDAKAAGKDTAKAEASLADLKTKITDLQTQANAAVHGVAVLQPDNGDQAGMKANHDALVKARADLKVAKQDLAASVKDTAAIRAALKAFGSLSGASASSTPAAAPAAPTTQPTQ